MELLTKEEMMELNNQLQKANDKVDSLPDTIRWHIDDEIRRLRKKEKDCIVTFPKDVDEEGVGTFYDITNFSNAEVIDLIQKLDTSDVIW